MDTHKEDEFYDVTVIEARWVVPVIPENTYYENYSLVVRHGKILDLLPITQANKKYANPRKRFQLQDDFVLIPGLVNLHCHSAMSLLRGLADDVQLKDWLMVC